MRITIADDAVIDVPGKGSVDVDAVLSAHGYDPSETEYSVEKGIHGRINDLEKAAGVGDKGPKKGVSHRLDNIEDEVEAIKDKIGMD